MCSKRAEGSSRPEPEAKAKAIDRGAFLRLSGSGLAGMVLFGSLGSATALAQTRPEARSNSSLVAEFRQAAEEHGIPVELLMAMG